MYYLTLGYKSDVEAPTNEKKNHYYIISVPVHEESGEFDESQIFMNKSEPPHLLILLSDR